MWFCFTLGEQQQKGKTKILYSVTALAPIVSQCPIETKQQLPLFQYLIFQIFKKEYISDLRHFLDTAGSTAMQQSTTRDIALFQLL